MLSPAGDTDDAQLAAMLPRVNAPVINLSLGGYTQGDIAPPSATVFAQLDPNVAVVAAAGNHGSDEPFWPAAFKRVIAVGGLDTTSGPPTRAGFSNYGDWVDIYAPGVGVRSTYLKARWQQPDDPTGWPINGWAKWAWHVLRGAAGRGRDRESHDPGGRDRVPGVPGGAGGGEVGARAGAESRGRAGPWPGGWSYIPQPGVIG